VFPRSGSLLVSPLFPKPPIPLTSAALLALHAAAATMAPVVPPLPCFLPPATAGAARRPVLASTFTTTAPPSFTTGAPRCPLRARRRSPPAAPASATSTPSMFGGGFLGVGPAEVFVIVAVGWLVLGPQRLFAVARDAGKVLGQVRKTADDAKNSFSDALGAESLGIGDLSDPLGLGTSVAAAKARKVQEKEAEQEREREREAAATAGASPEGGKPVAGAADAVAAAVSAEPAGPAPAPVTAAAKATEQPVGAMADKPVTATTGPAKPVAAKQGAAKPGPAPPAAPTTVNGAVPEALVRTPDDRPGEEAMAHFQDQLRRVNDPNQKADLYVNGVSGCLRGLPPRTAPGSCSLGVRRSPSFALAPAGVAPL